MGLGIDTHQTHGILQDYMKRCTQILDLIKLKEKAESC